MNELTELMVRLEMEHLTDAVDKLLEQAIKEELNAHGKPWFGY
ncbi:hypothetical protein PEC301877_33960 [Pectobacterium carotovorum subsp. carotovorum]|nr:hypothetical protein PEC301877_33960 [Pectobacterium carotovorum subsp. carotovorum]